MVASVEMVVMDQLDRLLTLDRLGHWAVRPVLVVKLMPVV